MSDQRIVQVIPAAAGWSLLQRSTKSATKTRADGSSYTLDEVTGWKTYDVACFALVERDGKHAVIPMIGDGGALTLVDDAFFAHVSVDDVDLLGPSEIVVEGYAEGRVDSDSDDIERQGRR